MSIVLETAVKVVNLEGKEEGSVELPRVFRLLVREDLINKAFVALHSHTISVQGRDPLAGERTTAEAYNPPTGRGISRIPRVKGERYSKSGMAGAVASVVHGRLPHPPRSEKVIRKELNDKERYLALASAIAATANPDYAARRGHKFSGALPIVVTNEIEKISKVRDVRKFFSSVGLDKEIKRITRRARKEGSAFARLRRNAVGPLIVVSDSSNLKSILKSFAGVDVVKSSDLSVLNLAPGSSPGRLTIWTKDSLSSLSKNVLKVGERYAT